MLLKKSKLLLLLPNTFKEYFEVRISNGSVLEWSVIPIGIAMVLTPYHSKNPTIANLNKIAAILFRFSMVLDKMAAI